MLIKHIPEISSSEITDKRHFLNRREFLRSAGLTATAAAAGVFGSESAAANEYGFYANVNPSVDHPRWSQATERQIGEFFRRKTLMFNGYADQVQTLYAGMDLRRNY